MRVGIVPSAVGAAGTIFTLLACGLFTVHDRGIRQQLHGRFMDSSTLLYSLQIRVERPDLDLLADAPPDDSRADPGIRPFQLYAGVPRTEVHRCDQRGLRSASRALATRQRAPSIRMARP